MMAALNPPLTPLQFMRAFCVLTEKTVRVRLAYRLSILLTLLANAAGFAVILLVWRHVYEQSPTFALVPKAALFPYLLVAFLLNFALTLAVEVRFGYQLRRGLIVSDLLRPLGLMPYQMAQAAADVAANVLLSLPICMLAFACLGGAVLPPDLESATLTGMSFCLAFLLNFSISYLVVQASLVTYNNYGIDFTRAAMHQTFSGLVAPLAVFPPALQQIAGVLPFRHIIETPARIWLGQVTRAEAVELLFYQSAWAAGLLTVGASLFHVTLKRHQIQGG